MTNPRSVSGSAIKDHGLLQILFPRRGQSESASFATSPFESLKTISGRLTRLLFGRDRVVPKPVSPRLLVVDDEESICISMKNYFSHNGFIVDTACDLEEAERLVRQGSYQVIIQDLRLGTTKNPEGLEIVRLVHKSSPETRIVVLTAYGSFDAEREARSSGADAFLRKPQPLSQVAQVVQGLMESPRRRGASQ